MARPSTPPNASTSTPPDPGLIGSTVNRLRAEHAVSESASTQALLLHEIAVLEELLGDEAAAARDQLAAVNAEPEFREPLERLISIIKRRQSHKNMGKLLERLVQVSDGAEERSRALLEQALFLVDHENDFDAAKVVLEQAVEESPDSAAAWLALEVLAAQLEDPATRQRALAARVGLTQDPLWRSLLLVDLAELQRQDEDIEGALESLEKATEQTSSATFLALGALEDLGKKHDRLDVVARALDAQATLILKAVDDASTGDALGVPHYQRAREYAADIWTRAADAERARGDVGAAVVLLDRALEKLPDDATLLHARLNAAEAAGDIATAARLARAELQAGAKGPLAAGRWLVVAEAESAAGNGEAAYEAVKNALGEDPGCIPARTLQLDMLAGGYDPPALASALEEAADRLSSDDAKVRYYLLAADAWARLAGDAQGAKAALSQAGMLGMPPITLARVTRLLASVLADPHWYEESTRRLLAAGAAEGEQINLWFELGRSRLLRGNPGGAAQAYDSLSKAPGGAWLGAVLNAYGLPFAPEAAEPEPGRSVPPPPPDVASALNALVAAEGDVATARALHVAAAVRAITADQLDQATERLEKLFADDATDIVVAAALAALLRRTGDVGRAAAVLNEAGLATPDLELAPALQLEAGIAYWQAGKRAQAVECFNAAAGLAAGAAGPLLGWALRAANPDDPEARREALESGGDTDPSLAALERFALEVGLRPDDASPALGAVDPVTAPADLVAAATFARALWSDPNGDGSDRLDGLQALVDLAPASAGMVRAAEYFARRAADYDAHTLERTASGWAEAEGSLPAALEWVAATTLTGDVAAEVTARQNLALVVGRPLAPAMHASAALVSMLGGNELEPLTRLDDPLARLADLELALPGSDPRRRSTALERVDGTLGEDGLATAQALSGWNKLARNDVAGAMESFRMVVETFPNETIGWEGLRAAAADGGDRAIVAEASAALGDATADPARGAELWEEAALILIDELGDAERGEQALTRAVERDINRFVAFDRLFRIVRARKDGTRLLELIDSRLGVADDPEEIAKLFWERARVLREAGDREGALAALENVTMLEPDHVGALALSGEIYLTTGKLNEAAEALAKLSTLEDAPQKQRLMSGVAAVDIYEKKLEDAPRALEVLSGLHDSGLSTAPVRERLARLAAGAEKWDQATNVLEQLMNERDSSAGRLEAARLAMAIHRDKRGAPEDTAPAVVRLLEESPGDGEALDLLLSGIVPPAEAQALLESGRRALVAALQDDPLDAEQVHRLARIAAGLKNAPLRQAALGALVALGESSSEIDRELVVLDQRVAHVPQIAIDESALPELADPADRGPVPELMRVLAPTLAEALGPGLVALGVTKKERVDPRQGLPVRNEIAAWAGALGIGEFDLYVGGRDPSGITAIPTERPALVIGNGVAAPLAAAHRQNVARELYAIRRGVAILRHRDPADIAALVVASCRLVGVEVASPQYALLGEFERQIGKALPRRVKKQLPALAESVAKSGQDIIAWVRAATASLDRMAAIAAGDVSYVLGQSGARGQVHASQEGQQRAARLLAFVLSPAYLELREQLGMGVR